MTILRVPWRFIQLLAHLVVGTYHSFTATRSPTSNGECLPDPEWISAWSKKLCEILQLSISHTGSLPHERAFLVANHISWLDIPVISSLTHAGFLSKDSVRRWPVIGRFAVAAGSVFIKRDKGEAQQVAEAIATRLQGDRQLAIFPEGTTSDGTSVNKFFPRLFAAAIDTNTQVIPIALRYSLDGNIENIDTALAFTDEQSFYSVLFTLLKRKSSQVHVVFSDPIPATHQDRKSLSRASHHAIVTSLQELCELSACDKSWTKQEISP